MFLPLPWHKAHGWTMVKSSILDFNQRLTTSCPPWSGGNTKGGNPKIHSKYQRVKSSNLLILFSPQKSYKRRGFQNKSTNYSLTLTAVITTTITATIILWLPLQVTSMHKEGIRPIKPCAVPPLSYTHCYNNNNKNNCNNTSYFRETSMYEEAIGAYQSLRCD